MHMFTHVSTVSRVQKGCQIPWIWMGNCEWPNMGTGNLTLVLWKSNMGCNVDLMLSNLSSHNLHLRISNFYKGTIIEATVAPASGQVMRGNNRIQSLHINPYIVVNFLLTRTNKGQVFCFVLFFKKKMVFWQGICICQGMNLDLYFKVENLQ